jgi:rod shape determining protein RodA
MLVTALLICLYSLIVLQAITPGLVVDQLIAIGSGLVIYFLVKRIDSRVFQRLWGVFYGISLLLLAVPFLGEEIRGSYRWISLFNTQFQPSEIVKPILITSFAAYISSLASFSIRQYLVFILLFSIPFIMVFEQPDLGNAIVYSAFAAGLLIISRFKMRYVIVPTILILATIPLLWHTLEGYQKLRIVTFVNPGYDIQGAGYNARQALIAVGSGGLFGKGLGEGTQSKLQFLPEFHTDFIFASTVEQLGFLGGTLLLFLYLLLFVQLIRAGRGQEEYKRLVIYAILTQLFAQVFINIGMNVGIVPITGITLPLFSYGGSSILATFLSFGIIAGFRRQKKQPIAIR